MLDLHTTIWVVDDDPSVCKSLKRLINSVGLKARTYLSAQEFLNGRGEDSGLLILDMEMPGLNGLELQKKLVRSGSNIPIIFITAYDDSKAQKSAMEDGAIAFLFKPFDDQVLLDAISHGMEMIRFQRIGP